MSSKMFFPIKFPSSSSMSFFLKKTVATIDDSKIKTLPMSFPIFHHEIDSNYPLFNPDQLSFILPYNDKTSLFTLS